MMAMVWPLRHAWMTGHATGLGAKTDKCIYRYTSKARWLAELNSLYDICWDELQLWEGFNVKTDLYTRTSAETSTVTSTSFVPFHKRLCLYDP